MINLDQNINNVLILFTEAIDERAGREFEYYNEGYFEIMSANTLYAVQKQKRIVKSYWGKIISMLENCYYFENNQFKRYTSDHPTVKKFNNQFAEILKTGHSWRKAFELFTEAIKLMKYYPPDQYDNTNETFTCEFYYGKISSYNSFNLKDIKDTIKAIPPMPPKGTAYFKKIVPLGDFGCVLSFVQSKIDLNVLLPYSFTEIDCIPHSFVKNGKSYTYYTDFYEYSRFWQSRFYTTKKLPVPQKKIKITAGVTRSEYRQFSGYKRDINKTYSMRQFDDFGKLSFTMKRPEVIERVETQTLPNGNVESHRYPRSVKYQYQLFYDLTRTPFKHKF